MDDLPASAAAYAFAEDRFGAYVANQIRTPAVYVNGIPARALVEGLFADPTAFTLTSTRTLSIASKLLRLPQRASSNLEAYKRVKAHAVKQRKGFRIDFFSSGIHLSLTAVGAVLLGTSSFVGYRLFSLAWRMYWKAV